VEPLPATEEALDEVVGDPDLRDLLVAMASDAERIVPACVGLSLSLLNDNLTFTLVASNQQVALIDATQYLDGGPCVEAASVDEMIDVDVDDLLDENRWSLYARASAAAGVLSSLSLPIRDDRGTVIGGINLYAAEPDAFVGHHEELAEALGAWAGGAVTDADLQFRTREAAAEAPGTLADLRDIDLALGILAARWGVDIEGARTRLERSARQAGVSLPEAARLVARLHTPDA
jgi:GAF domain-containing protein